MLLSLITSSVDALLLRTPRSGTTRMSQASGDRAAMKAAAIHVAQRGAFLRVAVPGNRLEAVQANVDAMASECMRPVLRARCPR